MWRLTASVSEPLLNALALHVTVTDDDSHIVSESQTDESVESAGMCHCFPVLNARTHQRASFSGNKQVCTLWCACAAVLSCKSFPLHLAPSHCVTLGALLHSQARTAVADSTSGTGSLSPPSRHLGPHASPIIGDCVWTNVKPRWRSGRHSTCPQAATIVVVGVCAGDAPR
jgi:hypothetical protein